MRHVSLKRSLTNENITSPVRDSWGVWSHSLGRLSLLHSAIGKRFLDVMDVDALFPVQYVNFSEHGAASEAVGSSEISRPATEFMEEEKASAVGKVIQQTSAADGVFRAQANTTVC